MIVNYANKCIYLPDGCPLSKLKEITKELKGNWRIFIITNEPQEHGDTSRIEVNEVNEPIGFKREKTIL